MLCNASNRYYLSGACPPFYTLIGRQQNSSKAVQVQRSTTYFAEQTKLKMLLEHIF